MGEKKHSINLIFTLALLGIFALSALFVAVLGAQVYGRTAENMNNNFNVRTSLVYITEKIRQCPEKNIRVSEVDDSQALVLTRDMNGADYETWIFSTDRKLREVMVQKGEDVKANDGQEVMEINSFTLSLNGDLLEITVFDDTGRKYSTAVSIKN